MTFDRNGSKVMTQGHDWGHNNTGLSEIVRVFVTRGRAWHGPTQANVTEAPLRDVLADKVRPNARQI